MTAAAVPGGLLDFMAEAERKAWESLGKHDYTGFAKHATACQAAREIGRITGPSPFRTLVQMARAQSAVNKRKGEDNGAS